MACTNPTFTPEGGSPISLVVESSDATTLNSADGTLAIELENTGLEICPCEDQLFGTLVHWEGLYIFDGTVLFSATLA
jgi:hypothetical protein